jgi:hypothetical protein
LVLNAYFAYAAHAGPLLAGAGFENYASEAELSKQKKKGRNIRKKKRSSLLRK